MSESSVMALVQEALTVTLMLVAPILLVSMVVGLIVSIFQAVTQISEMTLTFVPKLVAMFATIAILGTWMLRYVVEFTARLFASLPNLAH